MVATIPVGSLPLGIAYNSNNHDMYVANSIDGTVSVIDISTNTVVGTITVGGGSRVIAYNSNNNDMYVTNSAVDTVSVIATPPISNAGSSQTVQLDGSASSDPSGFTPLTYLWTQTSGPAVSLSNPTSATPSFVTPQVTTNTDITFQLVVTTTKGVQSSPSFVTITVEPSPINGNGGLSIGGQGGTGGNAIAYSGNSNGGNGGPDFNGGYNTGNYGGAGGNGGSGRHSGSTSSSAGSGGRGGSAGFGSMPMFSNIP